jgi:hypothetical protein
MLQGIRLSVHRQSVVVHGMYGLTVNCLGEVSILVPEEFPEEAREVPASGGQGDVL